MSRAGASFLCLLALALPGIGRAQTGAVVFENPTHDFPQRISYRRRGPDSLVARVDGVRGGRDGGSEFPYRRVACP